MALTLYVDGDRWRAHLKDVLTRNPGLVPVAKGNGYGFGLHRLARKAEWLGVDTLAVGTYDELAHVEPAVRRVAARAHPVAAVQTRRRDDPRVIHTVGRLEDLDGARPSRAVDRRASARRPRAADLDAAPRLHRRGLREAGRPIADGSAASRSRASRCTCRSPEDPART